MAPGDESCDHSPMRKGHRTRNQIVDRALALAGDVGLENVTLGVLAADIGLSKSGLFAHFKSKEALQLAVLNEAVERFTAIVVAPALAEPRGEPRFVALFEHYLGWIHFSVDRPVSSVTRRRKSEPSTGRCIFMALSQEYDDRPGDIRDAVARSQQDWRDVVARAARIAVEEKHFRADLDVEQVAFEIVGIAMTYQQAFKLLGDRKAERRARVAFDALLTRSRRRRMRHTTS
jgi:AcrR family transcriptional regulator